MRKWRLASTATQEALSCSEAMEVSGCLWGKPPSEGAQVLRGLTHTDIPSRPRHLSPAPKLHAQQAPRQATLQAIVLPPPFMATSYLASSRKPPIMSPRPGTSSELPG